MALKPIRFFRLLGLVILLFSVFIPAAVAHAMTGPLGEGEFPSLDNFVNQVSNGQVGELRGVYVPGILAAPIVQQSAGMNDFVSPWQNIVTQFSLASKFGSTGLLAHNYLAGETFALFDPGQKIHLVYGDGKITTFVVTDILQYQAMEKGSNFLEMKTGTSISSSSLFTKIYSHRGFVIFQTCIQAGDDRDWGRLFVIAQPVD